MTDPYVVLGEQLIAAARRLDAGVYGRDRERQDAPTGAPRRPVRRRGSRRLRAVLVTAVVLLAGSAIALAAGGLLQGAPVGEPQGTPRANAGTGIPTAGGSQLLAPRAADPEGGPPWGLQLVHTTRGEMCLQVGRVQSGELGQLGIDGAFNDDGRFHPLMADILPNYANGYGQISCVLDGEVQLGAAAGMDRSAEAGILPRKIKPTPADLRSVAFGVLGPHAVSVSYRQGGRTVTQPVSPGTGAFIIVQPVTSVPRLLGPPGWDSGWVSAQSVGVSPAAPLTAITFRFGDSTCSVGHGAPVARPCPVPAPLPRGSYAPTKSLGQTVGVSTVPQTRAACQRAFLLYPCYRAAVEFKAPYAVSSAAGEYEVDARSACTNASASSWPVETDVSSGQTVRTVSLGQFNCLRAQFVVRYLDNAQGGPAAGRDHESVIVGTATLGNPAEVAPLADRIEQEQRARFERIGSRIRAHP
jgi:hypothetical protein